MAPYHYLEYCIFRDTERSQFKKYLKSVSLFLLWFCTLQKNKYKKEEEIFVSSCKSANYNKSLENIPNLNFRSRSNDSFDNISRTWFFLTLSVYTFFTSNQFRSNMGSGPRKVKQLLELKIPVAWKNYCFCIFHCFFGKFTKIPVFFSTISSLKFGKI